MRVGLAISSRFSYLQRLWEMRYFWFSLVQNDLRTRYKRSFIGVGWSMIKPIAMCTVLTMVFCKIFGAPLYTYAPFLFTGLTIWQFITESALYGCESFNLGSRYIHQQPLPLALFPLRMTLVTGFHAIIGLGLALILAWYLQGFGNLSRLIWLVPAIVNVFFLVLFMTIICGVAHTYFPDTNHMLQIVFQILFYLSPIFYSINMLKDRKRFSWALECNPFTYVLESIRQPILLESQAAYPLSHVYTICLPFTLILGVIACWCLKKLERNLVFWI